MEKELLYLRIPLGIHDAWFSNTTECAPAVTNLHTTNSHTVALATSLCSPEIDVRKGQRQSRQSCYRTALAYLRQLLESSPGILKPDQGGCSPARTVGTRLGRSVVPLLPWTSRQIAAARFFLSPAGMVQNCDIVAAARSAGLETHTGHMSNLDASLF